MTWALTWSSDLISRISILFFALVTLASTGITHAQQQAHVIVECKDLRIKQDAQQFFSSNLTPESTKKDVSNLMKRFYFQWPIKDIRMEMNDYTYKFEIEIKSTVVEYDVQGNSAVKEADIVRQLKEEQTLYQGDNVAEALLQRTRTYYELRGFYNPEIELTTIDRKETGTMKVIVKVKENKPCMIEKIDFSGEVKTGWVRKVRRQLQWKNNMRCDQEKIQSQIVKLKEKYARKRYYQFDIRDPVLEYTDDSKTKAILKPELTIGARILIDFHGNQYSFERNELMKRAIFLDQEKKFNPSFENSAVQGIKDFYVSRGYPFAQVDLRQKTDPTTKRFIFDIDRGPVIRLKSIRFEGNREISSEKLEKQFWLLAPIWTKKRLYAENEIPEIINGLLAFYQSLGYLHVYFMEPAVDIDRDKHSAKLLLKLQEGSPSYFEDFIIRNNVFMKTKDINKFFDVKRDDPIDPVALRDAAQKLEYEYQTKGFKYAKVKLPDVDSITEGYNQYIVDIDEGPRIRVGDIILQGNFSTRDYVITRELTFKSGDLLNPEQIRESRRRLLRLGFFKSVTIGEKVRDDLKDVEDIVITVIEQKKRSMILKPGVSTDDGGRLSGSFGYTNIAGTGRSAFLSGRVNHQFDDKAIWENRAVFTYLEPQIFNFATGKFNLIQERSEEQQFDISRTSIVLGLEKLVYSWLRTTLQWELEFRTPFNLEPNVVLSPLDQTRARFGSMGAIIDFDFRDNLLNATKGSFHRIQANFYDQNLLSDADFFQIFTRNSFYIPIYRRVRSVLSVRGGFSATRGVTKDQGIEQIPIEKRFRLGGNSSLRGFGRNCVGGLPSNVPENCSDAVLTQAPGGNTMINYLWDLLLPLNNSVDFVVFTDGGNAFLNTSDFDLMNIRTTAGFGIRYEIRSSAPFAWIMG
ncbi:MAG: POTRA domain-containing protein [Bdellovibrionota bacterium]